MAPYEIIEHTADVGIRAEAATLEGCFEQAAWALADILGTARPTAGDRFDLELESDDDGALLVDWLSEVLYLLEARDAALAGVGVESISEGRLHGWVRLGARGDEPGEGTHVKAITYHQLRVERAPGRCLAVVFVDV